MHHMTGRNENASELKK